MSVSKSQDDLDTEAEAALKKAINDLAALPQDADVLAREAARCTAWRLAQELGLRLWRLRQSFDTLEFAHRQLESELERLRNP